MKSNKGDSTRDMTVGSPMKLILGFSIPLLLGFLFQQFYNVVDTVIVGRFLGMNALAGVGATGSINFMIMGFCMGVCSGFAIPVAHKFGAKDYSGMRRFIANSAWLSIIFSVVMTVAVGLLCRHILVWMKTPEDIFSYSYAYISIIFMGIPATFLYNVLSGIIRSMGDARTPLYFLILSSCLNIGLDLLFIVTLKMGVSGAAIATVASQLFSGLLCLVYSARKFEILHISREEWKLSNVHIRTLCNMGVPMGLQYSVTAIGSVILQSSVNTLGSVYVASVTAASRVSLFFCCPFDAMGTTMATYGGQNVGAKKLERIGQGVKACLVLGAVYSGIAFLILYFFGKDLAALFVDAPSREMLANAGTFLAVNGSFYFLLALINIFRFLIQGMGFSSFAVLAGVFEMAARTLVGLLLVPRLGFPGVCFANPSAWIAADIFLIPAYFYVCRKLKKMMAD